MLEELDTENAIVGFFMWRIGKSVGGNVTSDYIEIREALLAGLGVDVLLLCSGVREGRDLGVGKDLG